MIAYYVVDAFADAVFQGNPAGVCLLEEDLPDQLMQRIAAENNLSETAFLLREGDGYGLRWFTPGFEIDLCGHATLASAHVVCTELEPGRERVAFATMSGLLAVARRGDGYEMSFPNRKPERVEITPALADALGVTPLEAYGARDLCAVLEDQRAVEEYVPDYDRLLELKEWMGIAVTARGTDVDFVSRFFCPELRLEDPVTGSSHTSLAPLWGEKLGKSRLSARQLSRRGGRLLCELAGDTVKISGSAVLYLRGGLTV